MNGAELRPYELVYVLQPEMDDNTIGNFDGRLTDIITSQGAEDIVTEVWGKRNLAYPIKRYFEGYYILHRFDMAPAGTGEIDRLLRYSEDVMRYLLLRTDE